MRLLSTTRAAAVALAASSALLGLMAGPAAATDTGTITAGTITIGTGQPGQLPPFVVGSGLCPSATIDVDFTQTSATTADTEVTAISAESVFQNPGNSHWYSVVLSLSSLFGTSDGSISGSNVTQNIELSAAIRDLGTTEPTTCPAPTAGTLVCTAAAFDTATPGQMVLSASDWTGNPLPTGSATLSGSGGVSAPAGTCGDSLIRSQINGQPLTVSGLVVDFP